MCRVEAWMGTDVNDCCESLFRITLCNCICHDMLKWSACALWIGMRMDEWVNLQKAEIIIGKLLLLIGIF